MNKADFQLEQGERQMAIAGGIAPSSCTVDSPSRSKELLDSMTEDQLRFSYGVVLEIEARRQLGRTLDGNLKTCRIAIQEDVDVVKGDLLESNAGSHRQEEG